MLLALIGDTHLPRGKRRLPDRCVELLRAADLILHAGDISTVETLADIERIGPPVQAIHGNVDSPELRETLPHEIELEIAGTRIAMTHDAGPAKGRLRRMRRRFPDADAVIFGHSHIPLHERDGDFQIFNPGSPTDRRRQPHHTMGLARAGNDSIEFELVTLPG